MTFDIKTTIAQVASAATLTEDEMHDALHAMTEGQASPVQMGTFLMALRVRGETIPEITGAARLLRSKMRPVKAPADAIDIVGTGGDGHHTYNVSTCAAFVTAGAGVPVAKHGNRSVSSLSGASDVLQALGVTLDVTPDTIETAIKDAGVGFLWAPMHHPAMKAWAPIRAELGVRTIFNLLGPLCNPASVNRQLLGVYDRKWVEPIAHVLKNLGTERAWVVHGADGLDELTTTGPTYVAELKDGTVSTFEVHPADANVSVAQLEDLRGGDAEVNAKALRAVLNKEPGPYRDIVVLNAGAALVVAGRAANLADGAKQAADAIDSSRAADALAALIRVSKGA